MVRRRILFWVEAGVLTEYAPPLHPHSTPPTTGGQHARGDTAGTTELSYARATCLDPGRHGSLISDAEMEDDALVVGAGLLGGAAGGLGALLDGMAVFQPYVLGILLSTGGLPLDRLHAMLKRFVVSPK
jgi:hypothetical protein